MKKALHPIQTTWSEWVEGCSFFTKGTWKPASACINFVPATPHDNIISSDDVMFKKTVYPSYNVLRACKPVCIYKFWDNEVSDNNLRGHKCTKDIMQVNFPEQWRSHGRLIMLHISSPPILNQVNPNYASISCKIVPTDSV